MKRKPTGSPRTEIVDQDRRKVYEKKYSFKHEYNECSVQSVRENARSVEILSEWTWTTSAPPEKKRNTLQKYQCIGGPLDKQYRTSLEVSFDEYSAYNQGDHWRRAQNSESQIFVWRELLRT